jgi:hypothetical protein
VPNIWFTTSAGASLQLDAVSLDAAVVFAAADVPVCWSACVELDPHPVVEIVTNTAATPCKIHFRLLFIAK